MKGSDKSSIEVTIGGISNEKGKKWHWKNAQNAGCTSNGWQSIELRLTGLKIPILRDGGLNTPREILGVPTLLEKSRRSL
jgi:hypothetical protein